MRLIVVILLVLGHKNDTFHTTIFAIYSKTCAENSDENVLETHFKNKKMK